MATIPMSTGTREVGTGEAKTKFCELIRRAELKGETIAITRRGKVVARIVPPEASDERAEDWLDAAWGLLADAPEVADAIDEAFRSRANDMPRPVNFP